MLCAMLKTDSLETIGMNMGVMREERNRCEAGMKFRNENSEQRNISKGESGRSWVGV